MYRTRNAAYRKVPWVRIPPSPPFSEALAHTYGDFGGCKQGYEVVRLALDQKYKRRSQISTVT